jgi:hypothetical protein
MTFPGRYRMGIGVAHGERFAADAEYMAVAPSIRYSALTALLVAVAVLAVPAVGAAKTHRFAPATEVTVSFALPKPKGSGTLIRFARNRVSLVRSRGGALSLRAPGRRTRRVATRGHRRKRIVVALSAINGRAKVSVRRRAASIAGGFVAENAVTVRKGRGVVRLRIRTGRRRAPAASAPPPPAAPVAPPASSRLFAPDSVWNGPLASDAPLDPANGVLVNTLRKTVAQNLAAGWGPWIATSETTPLYIVPADQATVRVTLDPGSWKVGLQQTFEAVPIPASATAASGPDAHMTIWQPSTDRLWEFFKASKKADGWHASFGGAIANVSRSPGHFNTESWPGLSQSWWGATATSLPVVAGTMMIDELKAGVIPHALAMNIPWAKPKTYSWPAQRTDGSSTDPNAIPEGARFRLDPKLDLNRLNLPPMTRAMAVAAQRYGMIVRDQTGHAISFFAENPAPHGTNPYTLAGGFYGGPNPSAVMRAFPWDHVQLVKMELRTVK